MPPASPTSTGDTTQDSSASGRCWTAEQQSRTGSEEECSLPPVSPQGLVQTTKIEDVIAATGGAHNVHYLPIDEPELSRRQFAAFVSVAVALVAALVVRSPAVTFQCMTDTAAAMLEGAPSFMVSRVAPVVASARLFVTGNGMVVSAAVATVALVLLLVQVHSTPNGRSEQEDSASSWHMVGRRIQLPETVSESSSSVQIIEEIQDDTAIQQRIACVEETVELLQDAIGEQQQAWAREITSQLANVEHSIQENVNKILLEQQNRTTALQASSEQRNRELTQKVKALQTKVVELEQRAEQRISASECQFQSQLSELSKLMKAMDKKYESASQLRYNGAVETAGDFQSYFNDVTGFLRCDVR